MGTIQGEVSEISFNGKPFSVDAFETGVKFHSLVLDGRAEYRKISPMDAGSVQFSGEWDMKMYPTFRPRHNGRPYSRRVMKKKRNKGWEAIQKMFRRCG